MRENKDKKGPNVWQSIIWNQSLQSIINYVEKINYPPLPPPKRPLGPKGRKKVWDGPLRTWENGRKMTWKIF